MLRYLETFYRHRLLLISPVVLAVTISTCLALIQPRTYEATAKLWFDSSTITSGTPVVTYLSPADQGAAQLRELLSTRAFCTKVAQRGQLSSDLLTTSNSQMDLFGKLLQKLRGVGPIANPDVMDDLSFATVSRKTAVEVGGPEIISVSFDYSDPQVAAGTLQALVDQFSDERLSNRRGQAQAALDFYTQQVQAQGAELAAADARVFQYLQAHPGQRTPGAVEDAELMSLRNADGLARDRYRDLLIKLDQAQIDIAATKQPDAGGFRVIDSPMVPYRPKGFVKAAAFAGIVGLAAGLTLMLLALMALTAADTSAHRWEDIERPLGRKVVGTVPRLR